MEQPGQTPNLTPNEDQRIWYSGEFGETRRSLMTTSYMYHAIREFDSIARRSSDKNLQEGWDSLGGNFYHDLRRVIDANPEFANQAIDVLHRSVHQAIECSHQTYSICKDRISRSGATMTLRLRQIDGQH